MITSEKLQELRQRMRSHKVVNDTAVVELTAKELGTLLETIDNYVAFVSSLNDLIDLIMTSNEIKAVNKAIMEVEHA